MKKYFMIVLLGVLAVSCGAKPTTENAPGMGMGMGGGGMMERHHATIPQEFAGKTSPVAAETASLERGAVLYATHCASCHGDGGMGDGPAGASLDPAPAAVAHTSQMMADDYLYWRITEGGAQFSSAMPAWESLDETSRWDLVNYVRALGAGTVKPGAGMGGSAYNPQDVAAQQEEMLRQAVEKGVISQAEADTFTLVHAAMEQYRAEHPEITASGANATEREAAIQAELVKAGSITQAQADEFTDIHNRLGASGLMP